ncbi:MAG TPA: zinc-ribbon domain-containing protein, partial [Anaeromyxobacteraceae bacterium]|nr:zinc-ribbon domain-containing protein [Anaeromyxobacteraceae bacterium]
MRVACPHCQAEYDVDERRIPAGGLNVKCPKCQKAFPVRKAAQGGGAQASTAVPLPAPETVAARPVAPPKAPPRAPPAPSPPIAAAHPPAGMAPPRPAAVAPPPPAAMAPIPAVTPLPARMAPPLEPGTSPVEEEAVPLPAPEARAVATPGEPMGFGEVSFEEPAPAAAPVDEEVVGLEMDADPAQEPAAEPLAPAAAPAPADEPFPEAPPALAPEPARAPDRARPARSAAAPSLSGLGPAEEEELEMLFGEAAPAGKPLGSAGGPPSYRIRRRSGKVFGPFQVPQIVEMLGKGELAGNEEISRDGETWSPIGTVPEFGDFIRKLNEAPPTPEPASVGAPAAARAPVPYAKRMAAARVAAGGAPRRPRWLGAAAAGGALVLAIAGAGVAG